MRMSVLSLPGKQHCLVAGNWNLRGTPPIASLPRLKGVTGVRLQASSYTLSEVTFQPRDHQPLSKGLELETVCKPDGEDLICGTWWTIVYKDACVTA